MIINSKDTEKIDKIQAVLVDGRKVVYPIISIDTDKGIVIASKPLIPNLIPEDLNKEKKYLIEPEDLESEKGFDSDTVKLEGKVQIIWKRE